MKKRLIFLCIVVLFLFTGCAPKTFTAGNTGKKASTDMEDIAEIECYVESFECGYISYSGKLGINPLLISTEKELAQAEKYECLTVLDEWWANNTIAEAFEKLKETYPIQDYAYLIEYQETASGGYYYHANKVGILGDKIGFLLDEQESPELGEVTTAVMGGFCHMAAIPKAEIEGKTFVNVVEP